MAEKKATKAVETKEAPVSEVIEPKKEEKERTVLIKLPKMKNEGDMFVSVNNKTFLIKRGVEVEVPESVAEVLRRSEEMQEQAEAYRESAQI